jgi:polyphosphate kinase
MSRRVEVVFPVEQADLKQRLIREVLAISLADTVKARELLPDGTYRRVHPLPDQMGLRSQQVFLDLATRAGTRREAGTATPSGDGRLTVPDPATERIERGAIGVG